MVILNSFFHRAKNTIIGKQIGYILAFVAMFIISFAVSYAIIANSRYTLQTESFEEAKANIIADYEEKISAKDEEIAGLKLEISDLNTQINNFNSAGNSEHEE